MEHEKLSSRLGSILISTGYAIGLGNMWHFPYIVGEYGGAALMPIYLVSLLVLGLPIVVTEFAVGRASRRGAALSFDVLELRESKWHLTKYIAMAGNYLLMTLYTTVGGWMLLYFLEMMKGDFTGLEAGVAAGELGPMLTNPTPMGGSMAAMVFPYFNVYAMGLQKGMERVTKVMMLCLLVLMVVLTVHSMTLPGGSPSLRFYLMPDSSRMVEAGIGEAVFAALGQSSFTLSIGIGALTIFGGYIEEERTLTGKAISIALLDILTASTTGLIILPTCFACNTKPKAGSSLIFAILSNVSSHMAGGRVWGTSFFLFMSLATFSTIIAVFQNITFSATDLAECATKKAVICNIAVIILLPVLCVSGFNL